MEFEGGLYNPSYSKLLLSAAHNGKLEHFKKLAEVLERMRGGGIKATLENVKDCGGYRALHYAAIGGSMNVLKYLLEEMKVDIDVKDGSGQTPLSCAAREGRLAAVEYLIQMGANPEITDDSNASPLHAAAVKGHKDILPLLLSKGINVDVMSDYGAALHLAVASGHHETVKVLLDHGAN
ncbi:hypothetical protein MKW94_008251, partial [Papaver nudicaule]|nr:hypothetical protein [Papaver nudicaule]